MRSVTLHLQQTSPPAGLLLGLTPSPAAPLPVPHIQCPPDWVAEVRQIWSEGGANTLRLAKVIRAARKSLLRGQWADYWRSGTMPFCKKKADMLVRVALLAGLNEQTFTHFPRGWSILYHLARLELDLLETLVRDGFIHTELSLKKAEALARSKGKRRASKQKRHPVKARVGKFAKFVTATLPEWSSHQTEIASAGLREILQQIESRRLTPK